MSTLEYFHSNGRASPEGRALGLFVESAGHSTEGFAGSHVLARYAGQGRSRPRGRDRRAAMPLDRHPSQPVVLWLKMLQREVRCPLALLPRPEAERKARGQKKRVCS